jgi:hypothetical protein
MLTLAQAFAVNSGKGRNGHNFAALLVEPVTMAETEKLSTKN